MTLATDEFIRRFLIHVLPKSFHRIRYYGLFATVPATWLGTRHFRAQPLDSGRRNRAFSLSMATAWASNQHVLEDSNRQSNHLGGTTMTNIRCGVFRALVALGGLYATPLFAQNAIVETNANAAAAPPLFQGIMVDAKGTIIGRLGAVGHEGYNTVIRQISGIWVELQVDVVAGFVTKGFNYWYQSSDCSGQAYLMVNSSVAGGILALPVQGVVALVSPATEPSIYFAGTPTLLTMKSYHTSSSSFCSPYGNFAQYFGLPQSVPVSSLGLTPPFSVK